MYPSDCCPPPSGCPCGRPCCSPPWRRDAPPPGQWGGHPPQPPEHWGSNFNVLRNKWSSHALRGAHLAGQIMSRRTVSQATCHPCCSWTDQSEESSNDCDNFSVREIPMRPAPPCPSYDEIPVRDCCHEQPVRDCCEPPQRDQCYCDPPKKCVSWKPNVMLIETWRSKSKADSCARKSFEGNTSNMSVEVGYCNKTKGECVCKKKQEPRSPGNNPIIGCSQAESQSTPQCSCTTCSGSVTQTPTMRTRICRRPSVQYVSACSCGEPMGECACITPSQSSCSCCEHMHTCSRENPPIRCSCDKPIWSCLCIQPPSQLLEKCLCGESKHACRCNEQTITQECFCGKPKGLCQCRKPPRRSSCNKPVSTCKELSTKPLEGCICGKPTGICECFKPLQKPLQICSCGKPNGQCACRVTSHERRREDRGPSCSCQSHHSPEAPRRPDTAEPNRTQPNQPVRFKEETFSTADLKKTTDNEFHHTRNNKRNTSPDQKQRADPENIPTNQTKRSSIVQSERLSSKPKDSSNIKNYATDEDSRSDLVLDDGFRYPRSAQKRERMHWEQTDRWVKNHGAKCQDQDSMMDGGASVEDRDRSYWGQSSVMSKRDGVDEKVAGAWSGQPQACYCGMQEKQQTCCCHGSPPVSRCSSINIRIATRNNTCTCNFDEPELDGLFISLRPCDCDRPQPCKCLAEQEPRPVEDSQPEPVEVPNCPCTVKKKKREEANTSVKEESRHKEVYPDEEASRRKSREESIMSSDEGPGNDSPAGASIIQKTADDKKGEKQITFDEGQIPVEKPERNKRKIRASSKCGCSGKGKSESRSARSKSKKSGNVEEKKIGRKQNRKSEKMGSDKSDENPDSRSISDSRSSGSDGSSENPKIRDKTGKSRSRRREGCKCAEKKSVFKRLCDSLSRTKIRSQEKLKKCAKSLKCKSKSRGRCKCTKKDSIIKKMCNSLSRTRIRSQEKLKKCVKSLKCKSKSRGRCKCTKKDSIIKKICNSLSRTRIRSQEKLKKCKKSLKKRCSLKRRSNKCRCGSGGSSESRSQNTKTRIADDKAVVLYSSGFHRNNAFQTNDGASDEEGTNERNKDRKNKNKNRGQKQNGVQKSKFSFGPFFSNMFK